MSRVYFVVARQNRAELGNFWRQQERARPAERWLMVV